MASPASPAPAVRRRGPARLWTWTACIALVTVLDTLFAWEVHATLPGLLLTWALPLAVLLTFVWGARFAIRRRHEWKMALAGLLAPLLCVAVWIGASEIAEARIGWDFERHYAERVQVVEMVTAGKLARDARYAGGADWHQHLLLPTGLAHLAHLDGDVVVDRDPATHAVQAIWFLEERPWRDAERGFVYAVDDGFDGYGGMYEITPLRPHWYWATEVR